MPRIRSSPSSVARAGQPVGRGSSSADLTAAFNAIRAEAEERGGRAADLGHRASELGRIFDDSRGQHGFALLAGHSALYMQDFFAKASWMSGAAKKVLSWTHVPGRNQLLAFEDYGRRLQEASRQAFVDVYTAYKFTKLHRATPGAREHFAQSGADVAKSRALFDALAEMHDRVDSGLSATKEQRHALYRLSLEREQGVVDGHVRDALAKLPAGMATVVRRPIVHLPCFPRASFVRFQDFGNRRERIANAVKSYELAEQEAKAQGGWEPLVAPLRRAARRDD